VEILDIMEELLTVGLWMCFFYWVSYTISKSKKKKLRKISEDKFCNVATSFVHAVLSGIGSGKWVSPLCDKYSSRIIFPSGKVVLIL